MTGKGLLQLLTLWIMLPSMTSLTPSLSDFNTPRWFRYPSQQIVQHTAVNPMQSKSVQTLPLFPLDDGNIFPLGMMPMHIFVMKYRQMMNDLYENENGEKVFGMICSNGQGGLCEIGTSVEILDRSVFPDGRQFLNVIGRQRFKINKILSEEPYLLAEVEMGIEDIDVPPLESSEEIAQETLELEMETFQLVNDVITLCNK